MICPYCGSKSTIIDTRQRLTYVYRHQRCRSCRRMFSTREYYLKDYSKPTAYIKRR